MGNIDVREGSLTLRVIEEEREESAGLLAPSAGCDNGLGIEAKMNRLSEKRCRQVPICAIGTNH